MQCPWIGATFLFLVGTLVSAAEPVARNLADSATSSWAASAWNSASGTIGWADDRPTDADAAGDKSLEIKVRYSGKGFEFFSADLASAGIPGRCRRISVWVKALKPDYSWALKFKDADGKEEIGGAKLDWGLKAEVDRWTRLEFTLPEKWKQPLRLTGIAAHNWEHKQQAAEATLRVYDLRVETDVSAVTDRRSLLKVDVATGHPRNLFLDGELVRYRVVCDSWLGGRLQGQLKYRVTDTAGTEIVAEQREVTLEGARAEIIELKPAKYGVYRLAAELTFAEAGQFQKTSRCAYLPRPHEYTPTEKLASPYGLNIHGGQPGVDYQAIAKTGFVWIRDYAYNRQWMGRARGEDGRYGGWPWYPKLDQQIRESGLMLLPCMGESLAPYVTAGKLQPDNQWKRDLLHVLLTFPQYPAWELDNEYDYRHARAEIGRDWSSYHAYHQLFGRCVKFLDERTLAVEQGTAGLHPEWVRRSIKSGAFDQIDVVNGHFYCGTQPPERCTENVNVGQEDMPPTSLFDNLRELAEAADCDGHHRQAWVTEFGWDTLAGHVVSEERQAAYLQRGYALGLQAGIDKLFWYWERDTKEQPKQFFDGCGLFDPLDEPKPAAAALAALAHLLKQPEPVGTCEMGPGTLGYVFRDRKRLVACAFRVDPDAAPSELELPASGDLFDMYGNALPGRRVRLGLAPVWIVGLPETAPAFRQTAYELKSRSLVRAVAGDACMIEIRIRNRRQTAIQAQVGLKGPDRWTFDPPASDIAVPVGDTQVFPITVRIDAREPAGTQQVDVKLVEGQVERTLTTRLMIVPAAELTALPLSGGPGDSKLVTRLRNNASQARSFVLRPELPRGWKAEPPLATLTDVPGHETRQAEFQIQWNDRWGPTESARVIAATASDEIVAQAGLIPGAIRVPQVHDIGCDGDLSDWPATARLPHWATGLRGEDPGAEVYLGYAPEGLYVAVKVDRARADVTDPRSFWSQDCLELFLDTRNDKAVRSAYQPTDHQFWLCPLIGEKRAYLGRWKRNEEIRATEYDVPDIQSACRRMGTGYVMETLLPASRLLGFAAERGRKLGLNLNLTTQSRDGSSEVFWPFSKTDEAPTQPQRWGLAELE